MPKIRNKTLQEYSVLIEYIISEQLYMKTASSLRFAWVFLYRSLAGMNQIAQTHPVSEAGLTLSAIQRLLDWEKTTRVHYNKDIWHVLLWLLRYSLQLSKPIPRFISKGGQNSGVLEGFEGQDQTNHISSDITNICHHTGFVAPVTN